MYAVADCEVPRWNVLWHTKCRSLVVCLIPMGLGESSVGPQIAECQKVMEASGLEFKVGFVLLSRADRMTP